MKKKLWDTPLHHVDRLVEIFNKPQSPEKMADALLTYFREENFIAEQVIQILLLVLTTHFGTVSKEKAAKAEKWLAEKEGKIQ